MQHSGRPADGSPMKVSLLFEHEKSARLALGVMGGGVRGQFRVLTPDWIKSGKAAPPPCAAPLQKRLVATMVAASGTMLPASTDGLGCGAEAAAKVAAPMAAPVTLHQG